MIGKNVDKKNHTCNTGITRMDRRGTIAMIGTSNLQLILKTFAVLSFIFTSTALAIVPTSASIFWVIVSMRERTHIHQTLFAE